MINPGPALFAPSLSPCAPEAGERRSTVGLVYGALLVFSVSFCTGLLGTSGAGLGEVLEFGLIFALLAALLLVVPMFLVAAQGLLVALIVHLVWRPSRRHPRRLRWRKHLVASARPVLTGALAYAVFIGAWMLLVLPTSGASGRSTSCDTAACGLASSFSFSFSNFEVLQLFPVVSLGLLVIALVIVLPATASFLAVTEFLASERVERGEGPPEPEPPPARSPELD